MQQNPYHTAINHLKKSFSIQSFDKFFLHSQTNFAQLSKIIKQCNLDDIHCRFNVWRLCLGVVSVNSTEQQKRAQVQESRRKYLEKKQQALKSMGKKSPIKQPVKKNPLLMMGPIKAQQHKQTESDQFLREQIHKDVQRTYQEMIFFQDKAISKLLNLLLFIWCRRNPEVSYKQGMNELLASVVVCYFKQAEFKSLHEKPENVDQNLWETHLFFNSVEHAESDIFSVFEKIIDIQGDMYKTEADLTIKSKVNPNSKNNTPILQRIIQIKDHKLKHMDLELFRILKLQDVQTKSFMLRWIRCMHTREFDLQNSFVIWDSIFLEFLEGENSRKNKQFQFIDAMCLAMFMYMRSIVLSKQTAGEILQVYQKFPALKRGIYLDELITLAWTICEQLRIQSHNSQPSQSNWFEESQKIKALHFMEKKIDKKSSEPQTKTVQPPPKKHQQHVEKQLKQTEHKKHAEINKKHSQRAHLPKAKQTQAHNLQQKSNHHQNHHQSSKLKHQPPAQIKNQDPSHLHKSTPHLQKQTAKQPTKSISVEETTKSPTLEQKPARDDKIQKAIKDREQLLPSPFHHKQTPVAKVPEHASITLTHPQILQILQNLNECLPRVRDIDAQSLIRRTIKKIQTKAKLSTTNGPTQEDH